MMKPYGGKPYDVIPRQIWRRRRKTCHKRARRRSYIAKLRVGDINVLPGVRTKVVQIHCVMPGFGPMTEIEKARVTVSEGYSSCDDSADDMEKNVTDDNRRARTKVGYL